MKWSPHTKSIGEGNETTRVPARRLPDWAWAAGILLLALALRLHFFVGAGFEDDLGFTGLAASLADGVWRVDGDQSMRRMTYIPIALAYKWLGGINPFTTHLYHLACSLVTIAMAYWLGKRLHGFRAGVAAALFLTFVPLHILYSTRTMPSLPETVWGGLAVAVLVTTEERLRLGRLELGLHRYALAGLLVGLAYATRETGVVMLAVLLGSLGLAALAGVGGLRPRVWQGLSVVAGFGLVLVAESWLHYLRTADPLYRWHVVRQAQTASGGGTPWHFYVAQWLGVWHLDQSLFTFWRSGLTGAARLWAERWRPPHCATLGFMGLPLLLVIPLYVRKQLPRLGGIIALWFLAYFLFLSFGVSRVSPWDPIRKFERYQLLFLTPAAIACGWAASALWRGLAGRLLVAATGVALAGSSLWHTQAAHRTCDYYAGLRALQTSIRQSVDPSLPIYLGWEKGVLELWEGYRPLYQYRDILDFEPASQTGCYVVATRSVATGDLCSLRTDKPLPAQAPPRWVLVAEVSRHWEFLEHDMRPVIYYIPP